VELARERGLKLGRLAYGDSVPLSRGRVLVIVNNMVGIVGRDSIFVALRPGADVILDGTLFIPPFGTDQRRVPGILGPYRLVLANGLGLHGTPYTNSIGKAATHGCIRLYDDDIAWLYVNIPVGAPVVIRK
jgi:lipoprotein-anchoring transpeptidase ErfK/SrfK